MRGYTTRRASGRLKLSIHDGANTQLPSSAARQSYCGRCRHSHEPHSSTSLSSSAGSSPMPFTVPITAAVVSFRLMLVFGSEYSDSQHQDDDNANHGGGEGDHRDGVLPRELVADDLGPA